MAVNIKSLLVPCDLRDTDPDDLIAAFSRGLTQSTRSNTTMDNNTPKLNTTLLGLVADAERGIRGNLQSRLQGDAHDAIPARLRGLARAAFGHGKNLATSLHETEVEQLAQQRTKDMALGKNRRVVDVIETCRKLAQVGGHAEMAQLLSDALGVFCEDDARSVEPPASERDARVRSEVDAEWTAAISGDRQLEPAHSSMDALISRTFHRVIQDDRHCRLTFRQESTSKWVDDLDKMTLEKAQQMSELPCIETDPNNTGKLPRSYTVVSQVIASKEVDDLPDVVAIRRVFKTRGHGKEQKILEARYVRENPDEPVIDIETDSSAARARRRAGKTSGDMAATRFQLTGHIDLRRLSSEYLDAIGEVVGLRRESIGGDHTHREDAGYCRLLMHDRSSTALFQICADWLLARGWGVTTNGINGQAWLKGGERGLLLHQALLVEHSF